MRSACSMLLSIIIAGTLIPFISAADNRRPNILVILADDLGIGDVGCYGNDTIRTPNIDKLAEEGVKLTHHIAAAPMCTPSRAALLTGRYPARYGLVGNEHHEMPVILHTSTKAALPLDEITLATALSAANYTTAIVGKWHLGMNCSLFGMSCPGPLNHGFQTFYGIPSTLFMEFRGNHSFWKFSIKQTKFQALSATWLLCFVSLIIAARKLKWRIISTIFLLLLTDIIMFLVWFCLAHIGINDECRWGVSPWLHKFGNSMLMRQDKVVETPIELDGLSQRLVAESRQFLADHAKDENPFFLYHSFGHVHTPMYTAPDKAGVSKHGRYGDNIEEMDDGVGVLLESLKEFGLEKNTIVYFTSDQGGHLEAIDHDGQRIGGHNGLFKGGKTQGGSEGAIRVPGIYRWPGHLPKGKVIETPTSLMDLMPTVLGLAGLPDMKTLIPRGTEKALDGKSIAKLLKDGDTYPLEERVMVHHCRQAIHALRITRGNHIYKMYLAKHRWHEGSTQCGWGHSVGCGCYREEFVRNITNQPELYDLSLDQYEDHPIDSGSDEYRDIVDYLMQYLSDWQQNVHYSPSQLGQIPYIIWRPLYHPFF